MGDKLPKPQIPKISIEVNIIKILSNTTRKQDRALQFTIYYEKRNKELVSAVTQLQSPLLVQIQG